MKILFFGDSITDAGRRKERGIPWQTQYDYGCGFVRCIATKLFRDPSIKCEIVNRGLSSNVLADLYARIRPDVWNEKPDVLSILVGINDVWRYIDDEWNEIYVDHFESLYRIMIEQTKQLFPDIKIILCEPYVIKGAVVNATPEMPDRFERFCRVYKYAKAVKRLAEKTGSFFLPLQEKFSAAEKTPEVSLYTDDGVHPHLLGAEMIADEWIKLFKEKVLTEN